MQKLCLTPFGELSLERWPPEKLDRAQAWDQADLLLLQTVHKLGQVGRVLVVNDRFGALTTALHKFQPVLWSDSECSRLATLNNLALNGGGALNFVPGDSRPTGIFDLVACRVPKSLTFWKYQLTLLRDNLTSESLVLAAGMTKHLPNKACELMKTCLGQAKRRLAVKKARILEGRLVEEVVTKSFDPKEYRQGEMVLQNLPNLFSQNKIDPGTELLISTLGELSPKNEVLDLACGNGVIGLVLQKAMPDAQLTFLDESYQAVKCANLNYQRQFEKEARFLVADGLTEYSGPPFDLITLNPPFHQDHSVGDTTAWHLLVNARKHLKEGGELRLVGNRHLAYHAKLKRTFGNCEVVGSNRKFVVLRAVNRPT